mgnify:CR=1 FL=1
MADALSLSPDVVAELIRHHPDGSLPSRHWQAIRLLTDIGPVVDVGAAFQGEEAALAYLVYLGWRDTPLRQGKPGYEGWEIVSSRARAARYRAPTLAQYGAELFVGLKLHISEIHALDAVWWRQFCAESGHRWPWLRGRLGEVLTAAGLLRQWMFELRAPVAPAPPDTTPEVED